MKHILSAAFFLGLASLLGCYSSASASETVVYGQDYLPAPGITLTYVDFSDGEPQGEWSERVEYKLLTRYTIVHTDDGEPPVRYKVRDGVVFVDWASEGEWYLFYPKELRVGTTWEDSDGGSFEIIAVGERLVLGKVVNCIESKAIYPAGYYGDDQTTPEVEYYIDAEGIGLVASYGGEFNRYIITLLKAVSTK